MKNVTIETSNDGFVCATVFAPPHNDVRVHIYEKAAANKWTLRELSRVRQTLEDVFVSITRVEAPTSKQEEEK